MQLVRSTGGRIAMGTKAGGNLLEKIWKSFQMCMTTECLGCHRQAQLCLVLCVDDFKMDGLEEN